MPPIRFAQLCVLACVLSACSLTCVGQAVTGTPPFGSFAGGPDIINLGNLNVHLSIPVFNKAGRGIPFSYNLSSDSSIYYPSNTSGILAWTPVFNWGWSSQTAGRVGLYLKYEHHCRLLLHAEQGKAHRQHSFLDNELCLPRSVGSITSIRRYRQRLGGKRRRRLHSRYGQRVYLHHSRRIWIYHRRCFTWRDYDNYKGRSGLNASDQYSIWQCESRTRTEMR